MAGVWLNGAKVGTFTSKYGSDGSVLLDSVTVGSFQFNRHGYVYVDSVQVGTYTAIPIYFDRALSRLKKANPPSFSDIVKRVEKVSTPGKMVIGDSNAEIGGPEHRVGDYLWRFKKAKKRLEKVS